MTSPDNRDNRFSAVSADIERARNLIPGFLKKTLTGDDKEWMAQFLNSLPQQGGETYGDTYADFKHEMAWVERTQQQLAEQEPTFDAQAGWTRLQRRIASPALTTPAAPKPCASPTNALVAWLKTQARTRISRAAAWWRKPAVGVLASAMLVAQMGLLAAVVTQLRDMQTVVEGVVPASGAPSLEGSAMLSVVFKDSASLLDVRILIDGVGGRVVDGPGALGVWLVAVPTKQLDTSVKRLSAAPAVESVSAQ